MKEKEPTKLRGKKQGTTTTNVGEAKVPAQYAKQRGITLVALVITIIVLLILAGVTIAMLLGKNGIITRAKEAKNNWGESTKEEQINLAYLEAKAVEGQYVENKGVNSPMLRRSDDTC